MKNNSVLGEWVPKKSYIEGMALKYISLGEQKKNNHETIKDTDCKGAQGPEAMIRSCDKDSVSLE